MEGRTSRSLSELAEEGAGEENSLLGNKEGEKATRMEGRTSRSLSELAEEGAGEENSLLGNREGEKVTSLDTLVPEEEVEAPLSVKQENHKAGVVRRRSQRKAVTRQNTYSDGDWTDSSLSPSSRPFFSAVQSPSSSFPQASATPSLSEFEDCHSTLATAPD